MNLVEMRARVRQDLMDEDALAYLWTNDQVDGAIQRAVLEYSYAAAAEKITDLATTDGSRELDISSLTGLVFLDSIEFPMGYAKPHLQRFTFYSGRAFMHDEGDGTDARVKWRQKHTLATGSTTIPAHHDEIIVLGATAHLAMSMSANIVDKAVISGPQGTVNYRQWGHQRMVLYQQQLKEIATRRTVQQRQLFSEDE
jgi:hypothetical protein